MGKRIGALQPEARARRDAAAILKRSSEPFGEAASIRYETLIKQALNDIETDPERPGSTERPDILVAGVRTYHLSFSRSRVAGVGVKDPCHFLVYRCREDGVVEVARILHDGRELERHVPETYRLKTSE